MGPSARSPGNTTLEAGSRYRPLVNSGDWAARASIGLRGDPQREARVRTCETALDPALGGAIVLAHDCLIGVPRTSTDYIRCFFDGLADVVSDAHLIAAPLFPSPRVPQAAAPAVAQLAAQAATRAASQAHTTSPSTTGQDPVDVVCVAHTNWAAFSSAYELNGAPVAGWRRTLAQPWVDPSRPIAYVLVDGRKCVGWLQTIYADTHFGDGAPPTLICSLSGWYVQENYRYRSLSLILRAMIDTDAIPTSSAHHVPTAFPNHGGPWRPHLPHQRRAAAQGMCIPVVINTCSHWPERAVAGGGGPGRFSKHQRSAVRTVVVTVGNGAGVAEAAVPGGRWPGYSPIPVRPAAGSSAWWQAPVGIRDYAADAGGKSLRPATRRHGGDAVLRQVRSLRCPYSRRITPGMVNPCNSIENTTTV